MEGTDPPSYPRPWGLPPPWPGTRSLLDQKQLPRIHRQREPPRAPSAAPAPTQWVFPGGLGLENAFNSGKRLARFCFKENQAEMERWMSRKGSWRASGHEA